MSNSSVSQNEGLIFSIFHDMHIGRSAIRSMVASLQRLQNEDGPDETVRKEVIEAAAEIETLLTTIKNLGYADSGL